MDSSIILTIAIPTYNRAPFLQRALDSIFLLNDGENLPIEINLYDNCSADNTQEVAVKYTKTYTKVSYHRNEVNLGADLNVYQCYTKAKGKYILVLGDDDAIVAGGLSKLIDLLAKQDISTILLSVNSIDAFQYQDKINGPIDIKEYDDPFNFAKKATYWVTFLSVMVVRNSFDGYDPEKKDTNQSFEQIPIILASIFSGHKNIYCDTILIAAQHNESLGYNVLEAFSKYFFAAINNSFKLSNEARVKIRKIIGDEMNFSFFPYWIKESKKKNPDFKEAIKKWAPDKNFFYYFFCLPIINLPAPLDKLYFKFTAVIVLWRNKIFPK